MSCHLSLGLNAGGARVDNLCRKYLQTVLNAGFENSSDINDYVAEGLDEFRNNGKRTFVLSKDPCRIKLGDRKLNHARLPIKNGIFTIDKYVFP